MKPPIEALVSMAKQDRTTVLQARVSFPLFFSRPRQSRGQQSKIHAMHATSHVHRQELLLQSLVQGGRGGAFSLLGSFSPSPQH